MNFVGIIGTVLSAICVIICIIVLIQSIRRKSIQEGVHKKVIYLTYGSVMCFCVSMVLFMMANILFTTTEWIFAMTTMEGYLLLYTIAQILIYWLLMDRIYHTFSGTKYALPAKIYIPFSMLLTIFFVCGIAGGINDVYLFVGSPKSMNDITTSLYSFGTELTDFIITIFLVILFIKKLLVVTTDINDNQSHLFINNEIAMLNHHQLLLLNIITKFFVLTLFATLATQIDIALSAVQSVADLAGSSVMSEFADIFYWWLRPIDCLINSVCLHLMLQKNDNDYKRICRGCDAYMRLCCKRIAKKTIKKKYVKAQNDSLTLQLLQ